jgi:hypothetical protein
MEVESAVRHVVGQVHHQELQGDWLPVHGNNSWIPTRAIVEVWVEDEPGDIPAIAFVE